MSTGSPVGPRQSYEAAAEQLRAGAPEAAESLCRQALQQFGPDPSLLTLLGATLLARGEAAEAEHWLGEAIGAAPRLARAWEGRADARMVQEHWAAATSDLEQALRLEPRRSSALMKLGQAYAAQARHEDAARAYAAVAALHPTLLPPLQALAGALARCGRWIEAEAALGRAVAIDPASYPDWLDLGRVQQQLDRLDAAAGSFRRAVTLEPRRAEPLVGLGTVEALAGRHDAALAAYRAAVALDAGNADALAGLGHVLRTIGDAPGAVASYRRCLTLHPDDGEAWWSLADFKTVRLDDGDLRVLRGQLARGDLPAARRAGMLFALGTELDRRQEYGEAFECFRQGNALRRSEAPYDPAATARYHDALIATFSREFLAGRAGSGDPDPGPIFIVGMPRSGSTLVEQILASHADVEGTHELPELNRVARGTGRGRKDGLTYPASVTVLDAAQLAALGRRYLELTRPFRGAAARFTDKMPNNFVHVGLLALVLPNARIIDVRRHPLDTCLSCFMQLFSHGQEFSYGLEDLGRHYLQYRRLMDHWQAVLPGKVLHLQYEALVADLEPQLRRLLDHCGLPWDPACLRFHETRRAVRSASSEQVRRPLNREGLGRWRRYEDQIRPLIEILAPLLQEPVSPAPP